MSTVYCTSVQVMGNAIKCFQILHSTEIKIACESERVSVPLILNVQCFMHWQISMWPSPIKRLQPHKQKYTVWLSTTQPPYGVPIQAGAACDIVHRNIYNVFQWRLSRVTKNRRLQWNDNYFCWPKCNALEDGRNCVTIVNTPCK